MLNKKTKLLLNIIAVIGLIGAITSCLSFKKYEEHQRDDIQRYLSLHSNIDFKLKPSGLYYADIVVGTGAQPLSHDTAYMYFNARYINDTIFGSNIGTPDTMITPVNEGRNLPGFDEAITYMKEGGISKIIIPSELGYGNNSPYFPAYTPIVFDIYLVKVAAGPGAK